MTDRDRLIELLLQGELEAEKQGVFNCSRSKWKAEIMADFLLENGVIVPPCKVGDMVFYIDTIQCECCKYHIEHDCTFMKCPKQIYSKPFDIKMIKMVGKSIFLTREEAEKALKEREGDSELLREASKPIAQNVLASATDGGEDYIMGFRLMQG